MASASAVRLRIAFMKKLRSMPFQPHVPGIGSWSSTVPWTRSQTGSLAMLAAVPPRLVPARQLCLEASSEFPPRTLISERRYGWRESALAEFIRARST